MIRFWLPVSGSRAQRENLGVAKKSRALCVYGKNHRWWGECGETIGYQRDGVISGNHELI